jgi:hypothetical protein
MSMTPKPKIEAITFTHREVVVTYEPEKDWFMCDLFTRGAATPKAARERIDDLLDKQNLKPAEKFERFEVWRHNRWGRPAYAKVTVTSYGEGATAWVSDGKNREKISRSELFPINEHNNTLIAQILDNIEAGNQLDKKRTSLAEKLKSTMP